MRPSLRFLALVVMGWAGMRAWTLGTVLGSSSWLVESGYAKSAPPPLVPTEFPPIEPFQATDTATSTPYAAAYPAQQQQPAVAQYRPVPVPVSVPVYYAVSAARPALNASPPAESALPPPRRSIYASAASRESPLSLLAAMVLGRRSSPVPIQSTPALPSNRISRIQVSAWAMLRNQQPGSVPPGSLAGSGNLGASQAGARLTYAITRQIAASFRTSSDVGRRGAEVAAGVRVQPLAGLPVWLTAERRQRIGSFGGRNDFAIFAEGGVYQRPLPWQLALNAYLQAGVVGLKSRDLFVDGAMTVTRPIYKNFSAGFGLWGGAKPGLYRLDAGPRVSMQVRKNVRVHFDWRQRLAGNALPGSGPVVTLAGDF